MSDENKIPVSERGLKEHEKIEKVREKLKAAKTPEERREIEQQFAENFTRTQKLVEEWAYGVSKWSEANNPKPLSKNDVKLALEQGIHPKTTEPLYTDETGKARSPIAIALEKWEEDKGAFSNYLHTHTFLSVANKLKKKPDVYGGLTELQFWFFDANKNIIEKQIDADEVACQLKEVQKQKGRENEFEITAEVVEEYRKTQREVKRNAAGDEPDWSGGLLEQKALDKLKKAEANLAELKSRRKEQDAFDNLRDNTRDPLTALTLGQKAVVLEMKQVEQDIIVAVLHGESWNNAEKIAAIELDKRQGNSRLFDDLPRKTPTTPNTLQKLNDRLQKAGIIDKMSRAEMLKIIRTPEVQKIAENAKKHSNNAANTTDNRVSDEQLRTAEQSVKDARMERAQWLPKKPTKN